MSGQAAKACGAAAAKALTRLHARALSVLSWRKREIQECMLVRFFMAEMSENGVSGEVT
jgi:hypothetical protein